MAPIFRYRYVDLGSVFTGDSGRRDAESGADFPATLFSNELACDVGGTCWGANEPLAVIDHHLRHESRFPCACAAVLHKAGMIREKFAAMDLVWLVSHKQSDFDALCSMYLARWVIEDPAAAVDWQRYGLHPDGWHDGPETAKIDWFDPVLTDVPPEHRWALLLAAYAARLEMRCPIACPRQRELHSVLYAALKRGRDYLNASSGATEFFDEVKTALQQKRLNPAFDSVLESSAQFAPELAMLDREAEAYERDLARARKAIAYLPEAEAPFADFFEHPRKLESDADADAEHLRLADTFRIPTDGIYLRDPECSLFIEWARVDIENSALGAGFEFTATAYSNARPENAAHSTRYMFSIDPERANGRHLYTVWSRLQTREVEALRAFKLPVVGTPSGGAEGSEARGGNLQALMSDPWQGGQTQSGTLVGTPHRGTLIAPPGTQGDLRDDPVAEAVRSELEDVIYTAASLMAGPHVTVSDFAAARAHQDAAPRSFQLNARWEIPAPEHGYFRFARMGLRSDVPMATGAAAGKRLQQQIAETLWQVLYPEQRGVAPADLLEGHSALTADSVGVWGERGIAVAQKLSVAEDYSQNFVAMVSLARDIDVLLANWAVPDGSSASAGKSEDVVSLQHTVTRSEELLRRAARLQHVLALPDHGLLRSFYDLMGMEQLVAKLRDLNGNAAERLRRITEAEQTRRSEKRAADIARVRSRMEWFEVLLVGFLALAAIDLAPAQLAMSDNNKQLLDVLGGPVVLGVSALLIRPWKRKPGATTGSGASPFLIVMALLWFVLWLVRAF
jgi:hypothetical protein